MIFFYEVSRSTSTRVPHSFDLILENETVEDAVSWLEENMTGYYEHAWGGRFFFVDVQSERDAALVHLRFG